MNYEPNLGLYDMRRDTEGLPKSLANRINTNICMKGGGGTTVTESGMTKEFIPYYREAMADALAGYKERRGRGVEATVADLSPEQRQALAYQSASAEDAVRGRGAYDTRAAQERALKSTMGNLMGQASSGGALGSARTQAAMSSALANQSLEQQRQRQANIQQGIQSLGKLEQLNKSFNNNLLMLPIQSKQDLQDYYQVLLKVVHKQVAEVAND